jgi:hypothetical protein
MIELRFGTAVPIELRKYAPARIVKQAEAAASCGSNGGVRERLMLVPFGDHIAETPERHIA